QRLPGGQRQPRLNGLEFHLQTLPGTLEGFYFLEYLLYFDRNQISVGVAASPIIKVHRTVLPIARKFRSSNDRYQFVICRSKMNGLTALRNCQSCRWRS